MLRRTPYDLWKRGVVRAIEVDEALFTQAGEALAALRTWDDDGALRALMQTEGIAFEPITSPRGAWSLAGSLEQFFVAPGAHDFGMGLYERLWITPWPEGRVIVEVNEPVCPAWLEHEPRLPWRLFDARETLRACDLESPMDELRARRALVQAMAMARQDEDDSLHALDEDDPAWDALALTPDEAHAVERDLARWHRAFGALRHRFGRELGDLGTRSGVFVVVEEENLAL